MGIININNIFFFHFIFSKIPVIALLFLKFLQQSLIFSKIKV